MRFLLFCNQGYGLAFEDAFRSWCALRGLSDHLVIHSLRGIAPDASVSRPGRLALRAALEARVRFPRLTRHRVPVQDVNGDPFVRACLGADRIQGIVAGFNQIFSPAVIGRFEHLYNFHPSLLPYYRGPVPSWWCIRNKESATGITLHRVGPRIDEGEILWQEEVPITTHDADEMDRILSRRGAAILPQVLDSLLEERPWTPVRLRADRVYRELVNYRSFPR